MTLQKFAPDNSQNERETAISTFERFLLSEDVNMGFIASCLLGHEDSPTSMKLVDRFMKYMTLQENRKLDSYPKHRSAIKKRLLKMD
ncbi:hypothetical protein PPTG_21088 [Phytophthora nicotianae INRA-310]|uniref:Uncharacterized protein n=1 Tax=Phytophthora nicotianae (strain INRA-310) TaxID=761204 RepID=W2R7V1_PHYN3|nr:hypothetical protein PPTG_21088 [Phytophthora nicotianae INRA-310]ETN21488.1 hypothetical protein PPTG_21088 [Phytophthora nicotianae INRA-310]